MADFLPNPGLLARDLQAARDGVGLMLTGRSRLGQASSRTEAINDHLRSNDAEAHGENNCNRCHGVGDGCTQEVEVCIRVVSELHKSACHSEQEDAGHHRYYRGKANGGEWHPPATRDWSKDPADQQTGDQGASRCPGTSLQSAPSHGMSQHADRDWPAQHTQWCREENTECGDRHARSDSRPAIRALLCRVSPTGKETERMPIPRSNPKEIAKIMRPA